MEFDLKPGLKARLVKTAKYEDTANALDAGLPEVFSTPSLIALMEVTSFKAVEPHLPEGYSAVGTIVDMRHLSATPVGAEVWAEAELVAVDRKKLTFDVKAYDEAGLVGTAVHERFIVEKNKFEDKTKEKI